MKIKNKYSGLRDFFILWSSQAVSELGTAMTNFALIIWVYSQEGTAFSITFLTLCSFLPTILFRFIAGAIADRWNKKRIMLLADLMADVYKRQGDSPCTGAYPLFPDGPWNRLS